VWFSDLAVEGSDFGFSGADCPVYVVQLVYGSSVSLAHQSGAYGLEEGFDCLGGDFGGGGGPFF